MYVYTINKDSSKSILYERNKVEVALINQNLKHFKKVMLTKAYQDKIYEQLENNEVRDRIINGKLSRDKCDLEDVCEFLFLSQRSNRMVQNNEYQLIIEME